MTPAEEISAAAKLMRERAQAAMAGPWLPFTYHHDFSTERVITADRGGVAICDVRADAEYIASMHPAVALALADWLGRFADPVYCYGPVEFDSALTIARAYLGTKEEAPNA